MYKIFVKKFLFLSFFILLFIICINYIVDPYGIYNTNILKLPKIQQSGNIRVVKVIKVKELKPSSIILGTSRAETAFDPNDSYFMQPSYNMALSGASMYEEMQYFKLALKQGYLKQVLFVVDYIMFNTPKQKNIQNFDQILSLKYKYKYLLSLDSLKDSVKTLKSTNKFYTAYLSTGQRDHNYKLKYIMANGGYLEVMKKSEKDYYKGYLTQYQYQDSKRNSFQDFDEVIKLCYQYNIKLTLIFGPSHIRQWEALDYYLGYNNWLKWKKDIVQHLFKISEQYHQKPFELIDFAIYNQYTAEQIPKDINKYMKYYWESSHYKDSFGKLVLQYLKGDKRYSSLGVNLTIHNIDQHLVNLKQDRLKYIDIKRYKMEVFGTNKNGKEDNQ